MALCDIHVAGCGEHLPAWGLRDDRIPGTDQAVRGGCHGQKLHSGFPPRKMDARGSADARSIVPGAVATKRQPGKVPLDARRPMSTLIRTPWGKCCNGLIYIFTSKCVNTMLFAMFLAFPRPPYLRTPFSNPLP